MTTLTTMRPETYVTWRDAEIVAYADDKVAAGSWLREGALERSRAEFERLLPQGLATVGHHLFEIVDETAGLTVGCLWVAASKDPGDLSAFVYDIEVQPEFRRQGHARAAFVLLEPIVRRLGLKRIGLHVFGHNPAAQALYQSLGYGVTGINMVKALPDNASP